MTDTELAELEKMATAAKKALEDYVKANAMSDDLRAAYNDATRQHNAAANPTTVLSLISDIKRLREALKPFSDAYVDRGDWADESFIGGSDLRNKHLRIARAAWEQTNG